MRKMKVPDSCLLKLSFLFLKLWCGFSWIPIKNPIWLQYAPNYTEFTCISDSREPKEACLEHSHNLRYLFLLTQVKAVNSEMETV